MIIEFRNFTLSQENASSVQLEADEQYFLNKSVLAHVRSAFVGRLQILQMLHPSDNGLDRVRDLLTLNGSAGMVRKLQFTQQWILFPVRLKTTSELAGLWRDYSNGDLLEGLRVALLTPEALNMSDTLQLVDVDVDVRVNEKMYTGYKRILKSYQCEY